MKKDDLIIISKREIAALHKILLVVDNNLAKARASLAAYSNAEAQPKKERKPRGPNKPKVVAAPTTAPATQAELPLPPAKPTKKDNGVLPSMPGQ